MSREYGQTLNLPDATGPFTRLACVDGHRTDPADYIDAALTEIRKVASPELARAIRHLQFSMYKDREPVDLALPPEERHKTPNGTIGTQFGRLSLVLFTARMNEWERTHHGQDMATGIAKALGTGDAKTFTLLTMLDKAHADHQRRIAALPAVTPRYDAENAEATRLIRHEGMSLSDAFHKAQEPRRLAESPVRAAEAVSDALITAGRTVSRISSEAMSAAILRNLPRVERDLAREEHAFLSPGRHPFAAEMALVHGVQYFVDRMKTAARAKADQEILKRRGDRSYARAQSQLANPAGDAVPSKLDLALGALQPLVMASKTMHQAVDTLEAIRGQYPAALRTMHDKRPQLAVAAQARETPRQDSAIPADLHAMVLVNSLGGARNAPAPAMRPH